MKETRKGNEPLHPIVKLDDIGEKDKTDTKGPKKQGKNKEEIPR